jgi:hypothetical protein
MKAIERRIEKLEAKLPSLPCKKPGHDQLFIFVKRYGEDDTEVDAKIEEIRNCRRCKDKTVVVLQHFGSAWWEKYKRLHGQPATGAEDWEQVGRVLLGDDGNEPKPEPTPRIAFQNRQQPAIDDVSKRRRQRLQNLGIDLDD